MVSAMIGFVLTVFGTPVGIALFVIYLINLKKKKNSKMLKISLLLMSGIPILITTFIFYALVHILLAVLGVELPASQGSMPFTIF